MRRAIYRFLGLVSAAAIVAACTGSEVTQPPTSGGGTSTAPATDRPTAEPSASLPTQTEFIISSSTLGLSQASLLAAVDNLNQSGFDVEVAELAESELATGGAAEGRFQFSTGASNAVLLLNQQGAGLKMIADRVGNEWTMYSTSDIEACADLGGKNVAIHSEGAVSTAMVRNWIETKCPGTEPNYLVISGSPNRLAAMLAGQIDASPLELSDGIALEAERPGDFRLLDSFATSLPDLHPTTLYVNGDFGEQYPGSIRALLRAVLEENRKINDDPSGGYLKELATEYLAGKVALDQLDIIAPKYVELGLFPSDGGLTRDGVEYTIEFFEEAGAIEPGLTYDDVADLSHLEAVLEELGS